jgi:hypothetical protein
MATGNLPARRRPSKSGKQPGAVRVVARGVADGYRYVRTREPGFIAGAAPVSLWLASGSAANPTSPSSLFVGGVGAASSLRYLASSDHARRNRAMRRIGTVLVSYDIKEPNGMAPRMKNFELTPAGKRVEIKLPKQCDAIVFEKYRLGLENDFEAEVRVDRIAAPRFGPLAAISSAFAHTTQTISRESGAKPVSDKVARGGVRLTIVERDTLARPFTDPWPVLIPRPTVASNGRPVIDQDGRALVEIPARRWTDPIPVSRDENGEVVDLSFAKRPSILVAGESGSGKSAFTHEVIDAWILDPRSGLMLWDGKGQLELSRYRSLAQGLAGPDELPAADLMRKARAEMTRREASLHARGLEEADPDDPDLPPRLLVIEEFTAYTRNQDFLADLFYMLVRVRVVNMRILLTVQRPSAKVMPTDIRDNVGMRVCHSVMTPAASDMCLGEGMAARGWNAQELPLDEEGTFAGINYLMNDGAKGPRKTRSWFVNKDMRLVATRRALELRGMDPDLAEHTMPALGAAPDADDHYQPATSAELLDFAVGLDAKRRGADPDEARRRAGTAPRELYATPAPDNAARTAHNATKYTRHRTRPGSRTRRLYDTTPKPTTTETPKD